MSVSNKGFGADEAPNLVFTCSNCGSNCSLEQARLGCADCQTKMFKVARTSTTFSPLMDDPDSQLDPYRQQKNNPDVGTQYTNFGGEGTQTSTVGGPNDRAPQSEIDSNPDGRPLPSDGYGSDMPNETYTNQVADGSPLNQPTQQHDVNPFNFMRSTMDALKPDDPYEIIRKRKFK
jgi:hypothetical protein